MTPANPQGKGHLPLLVDLGWGRGGEVVAKSPVRLVEELLASTLVLGAVFQFRPVPGKPYYLYLREGQWQLSMIAPKEWGPRDSVIFAAVCELQPDASWRVELGEDALSDPELMRALNGHRQALVESVREAGSLKSSLPFYVAQLPYYQRVLASALSASLDASMNLLTESEVLQLEQLSTGAAD